MGHAGPTLGVRFLTLALGSFFWTVFLLIAITNLTFFQRRTEKQNFELALARDRYWNLSKPWSGLRHRFFTLRNGLKLHYMTTDGGPSSVKGAPSEKKNLVIFIHGFPDSWVLWRHLLSSTSLQANATLVAVDLPGYGGSDSFSSYGATEILEALAEFVVGLRAEHDGVKVSIVGHDWGCILGFRLASEAPSIAESFVLSNGPHPSLLENNRSRIVSSASKLFNTFLHRPVQNRALLLKSWKTLSPLIAQAMMVGHAWAFQLPLFLVDYLGTGGNYAFLRGAHKYAAGKEPGNYNFADSLACSLGPSPSECLTETQEAEQYPRSVSERARSGGFVDKTKYYREGAMFGPWEKSIELIMDLSGADEKMLRRSSSGAGFLEDQYAGALKAPATIIWGEDDIALSPRIMLQGLGDYLAKDSRIVVLPKTGHWPQIEAESRPAFGEVLQWVVTGQEGDVVEKVKGVYETAYLYAKR